MRNHPILFFTYNINVNVKNFQKGVDTLTFSCYNKDGGGEA